MKKIILLLVIVITTIVANATIIKGKVTDKDGNIVSFATLSDNTGNNNTSTNEDGSYFLEVDSGLHQIECAGIGYKTIQKSIEAKGDTVLLDFKLEDQQYVLDEVVITNGEDPAYGMMRQVIANRKRHADMMNTFETDIYLKGVLRTRAVPKKLFGIKFTDSVKSEMGVDSNGNGILYLLEELSHYYYKSPDKQYNKVISVRESGNSQGLGFATMPPITNIYENNIEILSNLSPRGFISPANTNAFLYYKYKLLGSYEENGKVISKIEVIPKRKFEPLFTGVVYVVEDEWLFQAVNLTLTAQSQMNTLDTLRLEQTYKCITRDNWVIQSQVLYPALKLFGFDIAGNMITVYQNSKLNEPINDDVFNKKEIASYDSMAQDRKLSYWDSIRPVPLLEEEVTDFVKKDSINAAVAKRLDSTRNKPQYDFGWNNFLINGAGFRLGKNSLYLNPIINMVGFNTVEGIYIVPELSYRYRFNKSQYLGASLVNRYGFSNQHYNPLLKLSYMQYDTLRYGRNWRVSLQVGRGVYQLNNDNPITVLMNEIYTLLGGNNYMKLYEAEVVKGWFSYAFGNGFSGSFSVAYEDRVALQNSSNYSFSDKNKDNLTPNQPKDLSLFENHKALATTIVLKYQPGWKYVQYPKYKMAVPSKTPVFTLQYTKGIPSVINTKSDYDKWQFEIQHDFGMKMLGSFNYRIATGGFLNKKYVGVPDMMHINGNRTILANPYLNSFQLAPYYRFSNTADLYGEAHAEWHLGGFITNKIPLFRRLQWYLVGSTNTLYINKDNYYAEVAVGLENIGWKIARFGRIDFIAGYESGKAKPNVGVRIGLGELLWQLIGVDRNSGN